jgi:hypothetical protein
VIDKEDNETAGSFYSQFKTNCGLHGTHRAFLVIPMPDLMPTRTDIC